MHSLRSRISTLLLPLRIATRLGRGWLGSLERRAILATSYRVLLSIALGRRAPQTISLWFRGIPFTLLLESSADFALIREVFLDEEYGHQEGLDVSCVFDVGANVGAASMYFHCLYPHATIYAFEPDPDLFEKLSSRFSNIKEIVPLQVALSDTNGVAGFYRHGGSPLAGSLLTRSEGATPVQVQTRTISSMCKELGLVSIDILKFDIEGAERMLFASSADRACANLLIGEAHLDLIDMTKEEFAEMFTGREVTYVRQTAKNRHIVQIHKR